MEKRVADREKIQAAVTAKGRIGKMSFGLTVASEEKNGTVFYGRLLKEDGIHLLEFVKDFLEEASAQTSSLPFPDLAINGLCMQYWVSAGRFYFGAELAGIHTEIFFQYEKNKEWMIGIFAKLQLGLANLPILGGSCELLDQVRFDGFRVLYSSCRQEKVNIAGILDGETVEKGLQVLTKLCLPETELELSFVLPSGAGNRQSAADSPALSADGPAANEKGIGTSISVQKNIGPVVLEQLHLKLQDNTVFVGITAGLRFPAVSFEMMDLGIGYQLDNSKVVFALSGIGVEINAGPLTAGGSFLREGENSYAGTVLFRMGGFTMSAIGAYMHREYTSFFVFGMFRGMIGGPPCFTVTGLAAGFGYQRDLALPELDELNDFPFIAAALGTYSQSEILGKEQTYFPPKKGNSWFAAGILFNSFRMVDAVGILTVSLGEYTQIALLGKAILNVPFQETAAPIAHAELVLKAVFSQMDNLIAVEAELLSNSYILSKDCHLSGEFAFYTWYGGVHAGDFVLSLGGYHQAYQKPAHYPDVKRLALSWNIAKGLSAAGELYFALTPSCLMAGGNIKFLYSASHVEAWLMARVDIILKWKPYYYDFSMGVQVGVKVHLGFIKFGLELGCELHIWGPEFSGKARIKLWIISFTISFGVGTQPGVTEAIGAEEFKKSFLPQTTSSNIQISKGTIREYEEQGTKLWIVCAQELELRFETKVPPNRILFNDGQLESTDRIHIRPCGQDMKNSEWKLTLKRTDGLPIEEKNIHKSVMQIRQPAALWADTDCHDETVARNTTVVVTIVRQQDEPVIFELEKEEGQGAPVSVSVPGLITKKYDQSVGYEFFRQKQEEAAAARARLLTGLEKRYGVIDLMDLSENAEQLYCECPRIVSLGGRVL